MSKNLIKSSLLSLMLVLVLVNGVNAFDALNDPSLIAWWGFDEGTGTLAADGSGNGNNGTIHGAAVWVPGVHGEALALNGTDTYVSTEFSLLNDLDAFTVAGWVSAVNTSSYAGLFGQNDLLEFGFTSENGSGVGTWMLGNGWAYLGAAYPFSYPSWHHVAMTGDATRVVIYIDGQAQASDEGGMVSGTSTFTFSIGGFVFNDILDSIDGELDDVWVYSRALTQEEIQTLMKGVGGPGFASSPMPAHDANDVPRDSLLSWTPGEFANTHNVYFGSDFEDANSGVPASEAQDANTFNPGLLAFGETYFWRVDEVNGTPDKTVYRGSIWSFEVEPYSIKLPMDAITATASSMTELSDPSKTIDGSGLDEQGTTHSNLPQDMWMSNSPELSPWLMYEFDHAQKLDKMLIWNSNHSSEAVIGWGIKDVEIHTSVNGVDWTLLPEPSQLTRGPGFVWSEAQIIDVGLVHAKFVRLNILSNWGGVLPQYGVSEVQFYAVPTQARTPVPASGSVDVLPDTHATWRAGREASQHTISMSTDPDALRDDSAPSVSSLTNTVDLGSFDLQLGDTYFWRVDEVNNAETPSVWAGPVWSLSTPDVLVVDDFEGYSNLSPNRPFQTWLDGFGYSADEHFPVVYEGNGTGSGVGHDIWAISSPFFEGQIMEVTISKSGSQSMPFYYTGGTSQIDRTWSSPQDWTGHGIQTLVIYFYGNAGNSGQLYAKINNTKIPYDGDPANLQRLRWNPWTINLAAHSVSSVSALSLGVDNASADGMLLVDDILLYESAPPLVTPVAPSTEGLVSLWKLDDGTGTTTADSAGSNHGTVEGFPEWTTGPVGGALQLDGLNTYVDCGTDASLDITDMITLSAWVNPQDAGNGEHNPYITKGDHAYTLKHGPGGGFEFLLYQGAWNFVQVPVTDAFNGNWYHLAGTYDGTHMKLYVNGVLSATLETGGPIDSSTHAVNLGSNSEYPDRLFEGTLDDARIYNRVLSEAEILYLSNQ